MSSLLTAFDKLPIPDKKGSYAIFASGPMAVRGLREPNDLDVLVSMETWDGLVKAGFKPIPKPEGNGFKIHAGDIDFFNTWVHLTPEEVLSDIEKIDGHWYGTLASVRKWKQLMGRDKDKTDIEIIDKYLAQGKKARIAVQNYIQSFLVEGEEVTNTFDKCWPPLNFHGAAEITKTVVTNPTKSTKIPEGHFKKDVVGDSEKYLQSIIPLYEKDITQDAINKGKTPDPEKIHASAVKQAEKAVHGHKGFLEALKQHIKPGSKIIAPGSGFGHEQMLAPDYKWHGMEYQEDLLNMANQRNKMVDHHSKNYKWSFLDDPEEGMKEMGEGWEKKIKGWDDIKDFEGHHPEAIYLKHACGGLTDASMKKAVEQKIPTIFIASCCANRYIGVSHKIIAPDMPFKEYEKIVSRSGNKTSEDGKKAVEEINDMRKKYLKEHGYKIASSGNTVHGPYFVAKL